MTHSVGFHPRARADLFALYAYIEDRSGPVTAGRFLDRIEALCLSLGRFPGRGIDRADLAPDVRTLALQRRVLIAYRMRPDSVEILRLLYAGRDFAAEDLML